MDGNEDGQSRGGGGARLLGRGCIRVIVHENGTNEESAGEDDAVVVYYDLDKDHSTYKGDIGKVIQIQTAIGKENLGFFFAFDTNRQNSSNLPHISC